MNEYRNYSAELIVSSRRLCGTVFARFSRLCSSRTCSLFLAKTAEFEIVFLFYIVDCFDFPRLLRAVLGWHPRKDGKSRKGGGKKKPKQQSDEIVSPLLSLRVWAKQSQTGMQEKQSREIDAITEISCFIMLNSYLFWHINRLTKMFQTDTINLR